MVCRKLYLKICSVDRRLQIQENREEERQNSTFSLGIDRFVSEIFSVLFRSSVKGWLAPHDPYLFYERSLHAFQEGTGTWFLDGVLQDWLEGCCQPILWLRAKRK